MGWINFTNFSQISECKNYKIHPMGWILLMHKCKWMKYFFLHNCQEELGFATFRLFDFIPRDKLHSSGQKNSSLGPSALGMNFFHLQNVIHPLGWNPAFRFAKPNSYFQLCKKLYNWHPFLDMKAQLTNSFPESNLTKVFYWVNEASFFCF